MNQDTFYPTYHKLPENLIQDADNLVKEISNFFGDRFTITKQGQTTCGRHFQINPKDEFYYGISFEDLEKLQKQFNLKVSHIALSSENPRIVLFQDWDNVKEFRK